MTTAVSVRTWNFEEAKNSLVQREALEKRLTCIETIMTVGEVLFLAMTLLSAITFSGTILTLTAIETLATLTLFVIALIGRRALVREKRELSLPLRAQIATQKLLAQGLDKCDIKTLEKVYPNLIKKEDIVLRVNDTHLVSQMVLRLLDRAYDEGFILFFSSFIFMTDKTCKEVQEEWIASSLSSQPIPLVQKSVFLAAEYIKFMLKKPAVNIDWVNEQLKALVVVVVANDGIKTVGERISLSNASTINLLSLTGEVGKLDPLLELLNLPELTLNILGGGFKVSVGGHKNDSLWSSYLDNLKRQTRAKLVFPEVGVRPDWWLSIL